MTGGKAPAEAGARFERKIKGILENDGYFVIRTPASKSPADLVAIKPGQVLFVQCKVNGRLDPGPWNEIFDLADRFGGVAIMTERPYDGCVSHWRLTARKNGAGPQPMTPFYTDTIGRDCD